MKMKFNLKRVKDLMEKCEFDLLQGMLDTSVERRFSAKEALQHEYFGNAISLSVIPTVGDFRNIEME